MRVVTGGSNKAHYPMPDERRGESNCESFVDAALEILSARSNE
jgi:hypothetical protein